MGRFGRRRRSPFFELLLAPSSQQQRTPPPPSQKRIRCHRRASLVSLCLRGAFFFCFFAIHHYYDYSAIAATTRTSARLSPLFVYRSFCTDRIGLTKLRGGDRRGDDQADDGDATVEDSTERDESTDDPPATSTTTKRAQTAVWPSLFNMNNAVNSYASWLQLSDTEEEEDDDLSKTDEGGGGGGGGGKNNASPGRGGALVKTATPPRPPRERRGVFHWLYPFDAATSTSVAEEGLSSSSESSLGDDERRIKDSGSGATEDIVTRSGPTLEQQRRRQQRDGEDTRTLGNGDKTLPPETGKNGDDTVERLVDSAKPIEDSDRKSSSVDEEGPSGNVTEIQRSTSQQESALLEHGNETTDETTASGTETAMEDGNFMLLKEPKKEGEVVKVEEASPFVSSGYVSCRLVST